MSAKPAPTCVLPPASASYIVWLDSRPTARYAESERRGPVNRVRSVVADGPQNLGVITELARHGQAGGLMMEPHPGVFCSNVRTGEWEPDPEVPGSEMHELVHADGGWAGLTRCTTVEAQSPWPPSQRETIHVLEGEVTIEIAGGPALRLKPGDLASLP